MVRIKENDKNITPLDLFILNIMKKENKISLFENITIRDIHLQVKNVGKSTMYRRIKSLFEMGYIEKGFKPSKQETYYLSVEGIGLLKEYEKYKKRG